MARLNFGSVISQSLSPARSIMNLAASMRDIHADFEMMYVAEVASETTARCKRPHWAVSILLPVRAGMTTRYLQPGQQVVVRWEDGDPNRRFIDGKTRLVLLGDQEVETYFSGWWRLGVKMSDRWYSYDWDSAPENSIDITSTTGLSGSGTIIRSDSEGVAYWAQDDHLWTRDLSTGSSSDDGEDLGATICSLCLGETSGRAYSAVLDFVEGTTGSECYSNGYSSAISDSGAFTQGQSDCIGEIEYRAPELATFWAESNAPTEGGSTCISEWISGATVGYTEQYNLGFESEGCVVP